MGKGLYSLMSSKVCELARVGVKFSSSVLILDSFRVFHEGKMRNFRPQEFEISLTSKFEYTAVGCPAIVP